ncbi:CLUMA_CG002761, isoform A [Clunio marinus]|uniref:CLUMA_CG002761, isoform A n=1 Tax=Clunio marinus TaxID=568069 RepID=A0A1J1HLS4_9DIPT|nr:CLUMA_CG002761, isoform A [Clunio marinus]
MNLLKHKTKPRTHQETQKSEINWMNSSGNPRFETSAECKCKQLVEALNNFLKAFVIELSKVDIF